MGNHGGNAGVDGQAVEKKRRRKRGGGRNGEC